MTSRLVCGLSRVWQARAAISSLVAFGALAGLPAQAATVTISTATTTPLATATVDGGGNGDIDLASGGSITLTSGTALTLNSNNTITSEGSIKFSDVANTTGIAIDPGFTGSLTNSGTITLGDAPTTSGVHNTFATNKRGIILNTGGTFTGNITNDAAGNINIYGYNSVGVDLQGSLAGDLNLSGSMTLIGDNSYGVRVAAPMTGNFTINDLAVSGINSVGVQVTAPITGAIAVNGNVAVTGYDHVTPSTATDSSNDNATQMTQQAGSAFEIGANVSGGIYLNGPSAEDYAAVADGTLASTALTTQAQLAIYGSSNALLISPSVSGVAGNITIGPVGTGVLAYGLVNRGIISADGAYDTISAEAVRIAGANIGGTDYTTTLTGGLRNDGTIRAQASTNNATGLVIGSLATVPVISNTGTILATASGEGAINATALRLEAGASTGQLVNTGDITAILAGPLGNATAVQDLSGGLTQITNMGAIGAGVQTLTKPDGTEESPTGTAVALDLSATSNDITVTNDLPPNFDAATAANPNAGQIIGATKLGSGNDTFNMNAGNVVGAIDFGAGNDTLTALGGTILGDLSFGAGADALTINNGATVAGALSDSDGQLTMNVANGTLTITSAATTAITSASFGATSVLGITVDTDAATATRLDASGTVTFTAGAKIAPRFTGSFIESFTTPIVTSSNLLITGDTSALLSANLPFLYDVSLSQTSSGGTDSLNLSLVRKTPAELGIPDKVGVALVPLLNALTSDPSLSDAFFATGTQAEFDSAFRQLLPNYTDAILTMAKRSTTITTRQIRDRVENVLTEHRGGGAWVSETVYGFDRKASATERGYDGKGSILSFGLDDYLTQNILLGLQIGLDHGSYRELGDFDSPVSLRHWMGGIYMGARRGKLLFTGSAIGEIATQSSKRLIEIGTQTRRTGAEWHGWKYSVDGAVTYPTKLGWFSLRPTVGFDYLGVSDDGYTEQGGADPNSTATPPGNAVAMEIGSRSIHALTTYAQVVLSHDFHGTQRVVPFEPGQPYILRPELRLGVSHDFINTPLDTTARYVSDGTWFTIPSGKRDETTVNGSVGLTFETSYGTIGLDGGGIFGDKTKTYFGKLNATFRF